MNAHVIDVTEATFESEVVKRSHQVPVVVDFWAPWCGPCRALSPILEDLAAKGGGKWILAKVNSDQSPALSQAFGVRGIPSVKAIRDGKIVDEFTGALPRDAVERFVARLLPSALDERVMESLRQFESGALAAARAGLEAVLAEQPNHDAAVLALAKLELTESHPERTLELLKKLPDAGPTGAAVRALRAAATFAAAQPEPIETLAARVAADPADLESRFALALAAAKHGDLERAAEELLTILAKKRGFRDGEARVALLDVLELLGPQDARADAYRARLSSILFS